MTIEIRNVADGHRYELEEDGQLAALLQYSRAGGVLDLIHAETLDGFTGRGLAGQVVGRALEEARAQGWHVRPSCPYVRHYLGEHPADLDLVSDNDRAAYEL